MDCGTCNELLAGAVKRGTAKQLLDAINQGSDEGGVQGAAADSASSLEAASRQEGGSSLANLECRICPSTGPASGARAFLESPPTTVVLCADRMKSPQEVEEAAVHELVHAYDYLVTGRDLTRCRELAYSEVRAARAAECSDRSRSFVCSYFKKGCVRSMATRSTESLFPTVGAGCVNAVFDAAYNDLSPEEVPARSGSPQAPPSSCGT